MSNFKLAYSSTRTVFVKKAKHAVHLCPMKQEARIFLATGSNQGDRAEQLATALRLIAKKLGQIVQQSSIYETEAWGLTDQPAFLNQVLEIQSDLNPSDLLQAATEVEQEMGRVRQEKWGPRKIDIDLLFYGAQIIDLPALKIPHPQLHLRNFVLIPLLEIAPDWEHPVFHQTIEQLYWESKDPNEVFKR